MKRIAILSMLAIACISSRSQQSTDSFYLLSPVEVRGIRVGDRAPFTKSNLSKKDIMVLNQGQDIPFLLNQTPSVLVNSDAGTGVGYTGIRIRGTDATRINITLNGIPFNDAESQGSFFVNLPDFSSSVNSIQVQRGVGTSSNGTAAFGATVSLSSNEWNKIAYGEINNGFGTFNTWKNTIRAGSGLIDDHFTIDVRLSNISSDGYIDRASSRLQSFYVSGGYLGDHSSLRLNIFSGREKTYQAWNGVPEALLHTNRRYNSSGTEKPGDPYDNETDNYRQTHYQLFFDRKINDRWQANVATFLTRGIGYYENYKSDESFADYGLPDLVINGQSVNSTDLVRQKWLDNYFYGQNFSVQSKSDFDAITIGAGWTRYDGKHHGDVTWAKYGFDNGFRYYDLSAHKTDINGFVKWQRQLNTQWTSFIDLQYRRVMHRMNGFEENPGLLIDRKFNFINPKAGVSFTGKRWHGYLSYALTNKEPNRDDFEAGIGNQPRKETLHDFELGIDKKLTRLRIGATLYYMLYKDQLVLTGRINDVGAYTRVNVPNSYRAGVELEGEYSICSHINAVANLTMSRNKIRAFTEYLDDYDGNFEWLGQQAVTHRHTDIALSPNVLASGTLNLLPLKDFTISLTGKYAGIQYLDNTQNENRRLDDFYTQDIRIGYTFKEKFFKEWSLVAQVNNVFNKKYEPNGYTYGYLVDNKVAADNYYFPMAGTNVMFSVNIRL